MNGKEVAVVPPEELPRNLPSRMLGKHHKGISHQRYLTPMLSIWESSWLTNPSGPHAAQDTAEDTASAEA